MDKMVLIVSGGCSGSTHRTRVVDRRKHEIKPRIYFLTYDKIPARTPWLRQQRQTRPGRYQRRWRRSTVTQICSSSITLTGSKTHPYLHFFSADLGEIEARLAAEQAEPGISYFNARRELWLHGKRKIPRPTETVTSITRLEDMVREPQALRSRRVWEAGLGRISKRLIEGGRLKYNLPMPLLVCNTTHSVTHSVLTRSSLSDKNPVRRLDSRWDMAAGRPNPRVR